MQNAQSTPDTDTALGPSGVLVLAGYGLGLTVARGHLIAEDGLGSPRRVRRFPRVGTGLRRVIIAGHRGHVSLDALTWCYETGVSVVQLDADAEIVAFGGPPMLNDVKLRRAQAFAAYTPVGAAVAKRLIHAKLEGQAHLAARLPDGRDASTSLAALLPVLDEARTIERVRYVEARAAALYWSFWERVPLTFARRDLPKIPQHWLQVGTRRSSISPGPVKATSPAHAILNYLYAILEAEAVRALRAVGCDPALGVLHVDTPTRPSLACDLMEPLRPVVDAFVHRLLRERVFLKSDFFERRNGNCRLLPSLTEPLSATAPEWGERLAPWVEEVASMLRTAAAPFVPEQESDVPLPAWVSRLTRSPLTGQNRSHRRFRPTMATRVPDLATMHLPNRCRSCGVGMGMRERTFCDDCLAAHRRESGARGVAVIQAVASSRRELPPLRSPETRRKLSARTRAENARRRAWEEAHKGRPNPGRFREEFDGRLGAVPIEDLMRGTGFTRSNCRAIREGRSIPHPMYWEAIRSVVVNYERTHAPEERFDQRAPEMSRWRREIAPLLERIGAAGIERVTGLSKSYSRRVLHGHHVPHPRHWPALLRETQSGAGVERKRRVTRR
jgi:CRISPR-associated endonuclease Cas1